jgi:hypothetical protein
LRAARRPGVRRPPPVRVHRALPGPAGQRHFDPGDPYVDCNGNGRWDGNLLGGGADTPRFYAKVADPVGARALVVSNGRKTIAVEVLD